MGAGARSMGKLVFTSILLLFASATSADKREDFMRCFSAYFQDGTSTSKVVHTSTDPSYYSVWQASVRNPRFNTTATPKPLVIITPNDESHVQVAILCSRKNDLQLRIRSGGHDFEGLSYVSALPFVIVDLLDLRQVSVDMSSNSAWVQSGATLGDLYFEIAKTSRTLAFPAGVCSSVGVGGHFSGGGYGLMLRKFGLASDHVIDALVVDANGTVCNRSKMGEDLFWAIRGGGGNTFGVVLAWRVSLVAVPPTVTVFSVARTSEQNATQLVHRWQSVAHNLPDEFFINIFVSRINNIILASFNSLFLGGTDEVLSLMNKSFPRLGIGREDCSEMSWIQAILFYNGFPINSSLSVLRDRVNPPMVSQLSFKIKSDYVKTPIPETQFEGLWRRLRQLDNAAATLIMLVPYGGKMAEISDSSTPFPHRAGNMFKVVYTVAWNEKSVDASVRRIDWIRGIYRYMAPFVSQNPREAYLNYRDLDIGVNNDVGNTTYHQSSVWGSKYFGRNFNRLVHVKTMADPANFFRNEQSVPPRFL